MLKHVEKPVRANIVHHPSDALDSFGCYDSSSTAWKSFDRFVSRQVEEFELSHPQYLRQPSASSRRLTWSQPR